MRKAIGFLLLAATAASPLAAQAWIGQGQGPERADRDPYRTDRILNPRRDWRDYERDRAAPPRPGDPRDDRGRIDDRRDGWDRGPGDRAAGWDHGADDRRAGWARGPAPDYRWSENRRGGWDDRWRDDRRFGWQAYRAGNRAIFRAPRYYDPRGYDYRRWSVGRRADPFFYARDYWIADPWRYRLPPAYGSYRWVRYYDDVALIDVRSGLIEDIVYSFFWR